MATLLEKKERERKKSSGDHFLSQSVLCSCFFQAELGPDCAYSWMNGRMELRICVCLCSVGRGEAGFTNEFHL